MASVGELQDRKEQYAFVRFVRRTIEDKAESLRQGRYVAKDIDLVLTTPPYTRDEIETKIETWKITKMGEVRNGRLPQEVYDKYLKMYEAWKNGQELPLDGTPILGWGVISPAQQQNLIHINITTVESLAGVNDEGMRRIGMGALDLKNKAKAWIAQLADKGPLTQKVADLERAINLKDGVIETMQRQIAEMRLQLPLAAPVINESEITADDILPEAEPTRQKRK